MSSRRNRPNNLSASMPPQSMSSTSAVDSYEEKIRRKMEAANNPTTPPRASSTSADGTTSFEAKIKAKLASADNPKSDSSSSRGTSRNSSSSSSRPKHLSASMPPQSMDGDGKPGAKSYTESYEDKIRRKMEEADKNTSSSKSKQPSIMKTVATAQKMSSFEAKLKKKAEEAKSRNKSSSKSKSSRPKHLSMSMPPTESASMSDVIAESNHSGDEVASCFDGSSVLFDEVFNELQKFQNSNTNTNSTLTIPTSHSSFNDVIDKLGSLGLEEILKKRWENQYEALKTYEEENGNVLIPYDHPTLGKWLNVQCEQYKLYKERLPCSLSKKRYGKLKDVGFDDYVSWKDVEDNKKKVYGRNDSGHSFDKEKPRSARRVTTGDDAYGDKIRQKMGLASSTSSVPVRHTSDGDAKKRVPTRRATVDEKKQALDEKIQRKKKANKMKLMENYIIEDDVGGENNKNNDSDSDDSINLSNIPERRPSGMTAIVENPGEMSNVNIDSFSELGDILALVSNAEDEKTTRMNRIQE